MHFGFQKGNQCSVLSEVKGLPHPVSLFDKISFAWFSVSNIRNYQSSYDFLLLLLGGNEKWVNLSCNVLLILRYCTDHCMKMSSK